MAQCISKHCKAPVEPSWFFCAYCGTDNRPKTFRPIILACPHKFHESEGFCVRCGDCRDGRPSAAQRESQAKIGKSFICFGIFIIVVAVAVWQVHVNRYPGNEFIQSWYEEAYDSGGGKALRGDDYVSWGEMGGGVLFAIGLIAIMISRFNAGKRKTG